MAKLVGRIPANRVKVSESWCMPALDAGKVIKAKGLKSAGRFPPSPPKVFEKGSQEFAQESIAENEIGHAEKSLGKVEDSDEVVAAASSEIKANGGDEQSLFNQENPESKQVLSEDSSDDVEENVVPLIDEHVTFEQQHSAGYLQGQKEGFEEGEKAGFLQGEQAGESAGYEAGVQKGLDEGAAEASRAFDVEISEKRELLESILNIRLPLEKINEELCAALVPLVTGIAEAVLNVELRTRPELIRGYVTESLNAMPHTTDKVELSINPGAVPFLAELPILDQWHVKIVEDPALAMGSCRVSSNHSVIDQTLSQRLRNCLLTVFGADTDKEAIRTLTSEKELNDLGQFLREDIPVEQLKVEQTLAKEQAQAQDQLKQGSDVETPE
ncbi:MAG: flagellar assembly protein FliH [Candidatus Azotimanducaceae bacterium]|jgi:flagellar assembly protein FliH